MGKVGTGALVTVAVVSYLIFALKVSPESIMKKIPSVNTFKRTKEENSDAILSDEEDLELIPDAGMPPADDFIISVPREEIIPDDVFGRKSIIRDLEDENSVAVPANSEDGVALTINKADAGENLSDEEVHRIMENYDPRLDLPRYQFPPVTILQEYKGGNAFDNTEVVENKENIINALADHKINIRSITATVGPTVTLYEIVPERGVRLARIKSLENDIALNLSALGIRIIAPIPGRGTVGIEVPNKKPEIVSKIGRAHV